MSLLDTLSHDFEQARIDKNFLVCSALGSVQLKIAKRSWLIKMSDEKIQDIINAEISSLSERKKTSMDPGEIIVIGDRIQFLSNYL